MIEDINTLAKVVENIKFVSCSKSVNTLVDKIAKRLIDVRLNDLFTMNEFFFFLVKNKIISFIVFMFGRKIRKINFFELLGDNLPSTFIWTQSHVEREKDWFVTVTSLLKGQGK